MYKKISKNPKADSLSNNFLFKIISEFVKEKKAITLAISPLRTRKVFLEKFLKASQYRGKDRFRFFECAIELMKIARDNDKCILSHIDKNQHLCFELCGETNNKKRFHVHIREEIHQKDKKLFLISCFPCKK